MASFMAATALAGLGTEHAVMAQETGTILLDTITVSATRTEEAAINALASESVVSAETVDLSGADSLGDVLNSVPGLEVEQVADSPGVAINIRGLSGFGRVAVNVDGARQNFQASGHSLAGGSVFFEPEFLDTATVTRGPVANAYGSGAIGGVVNFETKKASTFLKPGETWAAESFSRFSTNNGWAQGATGATRIGEAFGLLGSVVYRKNWRYENGNGGEVYNSANEIASGMVKAEIDPGNGHSLELGAITYYTDYSSGDPTTTNYDNEVSDNTISAKYRYRALDNDWFDIAASGYWTNTKLDQTYLTGSLAGGDRSFRIDTYGLDVNNTSRFATGNFAHETTVGFDGFFDYVDVTDVSGGSADFYTPNGQRKVYGAFVQHRIDYQNVVELIAGLRYDAYSLQGMGTESSGDHVSPKITVGFSPFERTFLDGLQLYGTYAEGYRSPSITETLISGTHPGGYLDFLPNTDLKPETAHNKEIGINYRRDGLIRPNDRIRLKAAYFHNRVDDYIDAALQSSGCTNTMTFMCYQYQNIANALIEGWELEASYDLGWMFLGLSGQHQRGEDVDTGDYLTTIPANRLLTTVGFRPLADVDATVGFQVDAVDSQKRSDTPAKGYGLVNLFATYKPRDDLQLGLNVDNLFDHQYQPYLDSDAGAGLAVKFTLRARLGG
ncbi:TonB-dependent hemoglobin/transferrin/lactoferrin family receptor [Breoghania corrubedonensis]|nr:TonB-dependent hemoglobin/transferrin/lactoferrin family receptor [Breoghania corrubedonensis]